MLLIPKSQNLLSEAIALKGCFAIDLDDLPDDPQLFPD
jgi:hypothetical protein